MEDNNNNQRMNDTQAETERQIDEIQTKVAAKKGKVWKEIKEWIISLAVALVIVFVIQSFLFRIIRVDGHSMDNTLADGERLFVTVTDVKFGSVERNSVVICHYPGRLHDWLKLGIIKTPEFFVKRCVAIPGDTVYREDNVTHVVYNKDGKIVDEALESPNQLLYYRGDDYGPYVLGEDEYFVVGDNRGNSHDSRDWNGPDMDGFGNDLNEENNVGPISKSMIVGRVREVIWPLSSIRPVN